MPQQQNKDLTKGNDQSVSSPGAEEIVHNPNPRANENISIREVKPDKGPTDANKINSEITDGEDA
jgi:hypothetical protein